MDASECCAVSNAQMSNLNNRQWRFFYVLDQFHYSMKLSERRDDAATAMNNFMRRVIRNLAAIGVDEVHST